MYLFKDCFSKNLVQAIISVALIKLIDVNNNGNNNNLKWLGNLKSTFSGRWTIWLPLNIPRGINLISIKLYAVVKQPI